MPQVWRVRRTDVDDKKIREVAQDAERICVIPGGFFERCDFGFAEVDADGMIRPATGFFPFREFLRHGFRAGIIEAHAVDDGFVGDGAEHPGLGIARLRVPRHAAEFAETETERGPAGNGGGVLVHAGGEADRIGKVQSKNFGRQFRRTENFFNNVTGKFAAAHAGELADGKIVRAFRVLGEEQGTENFFMQEAHGEISNDEIRMTNEFLNDEWRWFGDWSLFSHYGFVIRHCPLRLAAARSEICLYVASASSGQALDRKSVV